MPFLARFRALPDKDKAALVRKLMQAGTPDFDYFYLIGLSTLMATLGLLLDSGAIVIGSMLIAPLMYPILGVALGMVMIGQDYSVLRRSFSTLTKSLMAGLALSILAAFFFGDETMYQTAEVMARTEPNHLHVLVAIVAGAAVAYMLARPEWSEALPGVAIAVALLPPLATIGIGIAAMLTFKVGLLGVGAVIIKGASLILLYNLIGIIFTAMVVFMLMNLGDKIHIADSTIKKEEEKQKEEKRVIDEVVLETKLRESNDTNTNS